MNLDSDLQCHEYEGDIVDEDELNEGEEEAPENRFVVKPRKISKMC